MKKVNKHIITCLSTLAIISTFYGCGENNNASNEPIIVKIDPSCPTLVECGNEIQLLATVKNDDKGVTWKVDDEMVATVTSDGLLKGISSGRATVTATSVTDTEKEEVVYVEVKYNSLISVTINSSITSLKVGEEATLHAEIDGDSTNSGIGWQVNNDALAEISDDGKIKILQVGKEGKVIVNAFSKINPKAVSDNYVINILPKDNGETEVDGIEKIGEYKLIYADNFNSGRLNTNSWEVMIGDGSKYGVSNWGNQEQQFYHEDNLKFDDGNLVITAKREDDRKDTKNLNYTSGRIRSTKKVAYKYGRIEARLLCPTGDGLWPAFWMLPESTTPYGSWPNSGEIDIMEAKGRLPNSMDGTIHYARANGDHTWKNGSYLFDIDNNITKFHTYAVEWEEGYIKWFVDNNLYFEVNASNNDWSMKEGTGELPAPFDQEFHILLNMAVGGNYDGYRLPTNSELPARYKIDYVKWYQK